MPEGVPTDSRKANLFTGRLHNLLLNDTCVVAAAGDVRIVGRLGLLSSDSSVDNALLNQHSSGIEVDMLLAKGQNLGYPHSVTHRNENHRPVRLAEHGNQILKLLRGKDLRFFQPLAGSLQLHKLHWPVGPEDGGSVL